MDNEIKKVIENFYSKSADNSRMNQPELDLCHYLEKGCIYLLPVVKDSFLKFFEENLLPKKNFSHKDKKFIDIVLRRVWLHSKLINLSLDKGYSNFLDLNVFYYNINLTDIFRKNEVKVLRWLYEEKNLCFYGNFTCGVKIKDSPSEEMKKFLEENLENWKLGLYPVFNIKPCYKD